MNKMKHKGNGHGQVTETPDVSHIKNIDVTHEMSDVNVPALLKFVLALTVMTIVVYLLMWGLFKFFDAQVTRKEPPAGPMAMSEQERLPPEPRLQSAPGFGVKLENGQWVGLEKREPQAEYRTLREQWEQTLNLGAKDSSGNPVGLPIEQAMKEIVKSGLPSKIKQLPEEGPGWQAQDYGMSLPTAASSGRVAVKGGK